MRESEASFFCFDRLNEVAKLFSAVSGRTFDESVDLIRTTEEGRAILRGNPSALYEQATENLWAVARELGEHDPEIKEKFTVERIVAAYAQEETAEFPTVRNIFSAAATLKGAQRDAVERTRRRQARSRSRADGGMRKRAEGQMMEKIREKNPRNQDILHPLPGMKRNFLGDSALKERNISSVSVFFQFPQRGRRHEPLVLSRF